tara:strand:- start:162 stop:320 length:159 start_codon:yes stop_codon:yes gene_type:complete
VYDREGKKYWNGAYQKSYYRQITDDSRLKSAPVIIERDHRWSINPSFFAKDD